MRPSQYIKNSLEKFLKEKIADVQALDNKYGTNQYVYRTVTTVGKEYFVKMCRNASRNEIKGYYELSAYIPTQKLIFSGVFDNTLFVVYEYINGTLFTDLILREEEKNENSVSILKLEDIKNQMLLNMYKLTKRNIDYISYKNCVTNELFYGRLFGERYQEYFGSKNYPIVSMLSKKIILNGIDFQTTGIEIIRKLKHKYKLAKNRIADAILGHGDAHHQNIFYDYRTKKIYFIDYEYYGKIPIAMEISKPYYIDFLGTMFLFFEQKLLKHFKFVKVESNTISLNCEILIQSLPQLHLKITENKVKHFGNMILNSKDFLSFNDYLVLAHLFSRNPNYYTSNGKILFTVMTVLLNRFDPLNPKTLFDFFR